MTSRRDTVAKPSERGGLSRRRFLTAASTSVAGATVAGSVLADSLADGPARARGALLGGNSERSQYVQLSRIPEAAPGLRKVDPGNAINSKTPLNKLVGIITPSDLHYERSHSGVPDLDPARHRLLIEGSVQKPLVLTVDALKAMPACSRIRFIDCTGTAVQNCENAHP